MNPSDKKATDPQASVPLPGPGPAEDGGALPTIPLPEPPQLSQPAPSDAPPTAPPTPSLGATSDPDLSADDNDLIEKEWVNKAKQIVERTRDDPYKQSEDLTLFKADYIKKRYGKTIKVSQ